VFDDGDDDDIFGDLAELTDEGEQAPRAQDEFLSYLLPFLLMIDALSTQQPFFINYMCVLIDDKGGTVRGLKRHLYFCNSGDPRYVSNLMLGYRLALVRDHCRLDLATYMSLCKCFNNNTCHQGYDNAAAPPVDGGGVGGAIDQRLIKLDSLLTFLNDMQGVINYNYPQHVTEIAAACNVPLAQAPPNGRAPGVVLPYFIFYEFPQKDGDNIRNTRESAGYSSHNDFPALRLLRLLWRSAGCVADARQFYEGECGDAYNYQLDRMYHFLTLG